MEKIQRPDSEPFCNELEVVHQRSYVQTGMIQILCAFQKIDILEHRTRLFSMIVIIYL